MKPRPILYSSIIACLLATAARAVIYPYAEYHLGEAGSLGGSNKPQDDAGNNHHIGNDINGGSATVSTTSLPANATGSTACLDTSKPDNEGWYGDDNLYSTLPTDNFAFGVFARAAENSDATRGDVFTLGNAAGSHKVNLEGNGWSSSAHNVNWIAPPGGVPGSFTPNTWVHLAVIRTGGISTFYIDGVAHGTFSGAAVHKAPHISVAPGGGAYFDGQLDEARIVTFTANESTASIITALQAGVIPTAFVEVGPAVVFGKANLSTDQTSVFRLGGTVEDSVTISKDGGLTVVAGTAPKHLIQISQEGPIATGTYPLIHYTGTFGGLGFAGLQLAPLPGRVVGHLVNNTVDHSIDLEITGSVAGDITWTGSGSGTWNVEGNSNWVFTGGSTPTKFFAGDTVSFNENALTNTVTVAETVTPAQVFISGPDNYSFSGAGIGGSASLEKTGSGTLTFTNPNTHTGQISIFEGNVVVGDGGTSGSLGTGTLFLDTNLTINRSGTLTMPNAISGAGSIEKLGDGRLVLGGNSGFTGTVTVTAGVLASGNGNCLGSNTAGTTVAAGAGLDAFSGGFGSEPITVNGTGVSGEGVIVNTAAAGQLDGVMHLILASDSSIGGGNRWDIRGDDATVTGNFTLTKIGTNQISVVNADVSVPNIVIQSGLLALERGANVDNASAGTLTINAGGGLGFGDFGLAVVCTKPILMNGGRMTTTWWDADGSAVVAAPVQLEGSNHFQTWSGTTLTYNGDFTGSGSLVKDDFGTVLLNGAHSWAGNTTVTGGTLSLTQIGLADGADVSITGGILNLNFTGTDTISALFIGGVQQAPGVYDSSHPSGRITGDGSLTVTAVPPYLSWEIANGIAGAGSAADSDGDGISNGIEFVIGGDPSGPDSNSNSLSPTATKNATHLVFVFRRTTASESASPAVEYSTSLGGWTTAQNGNGGVTIAEEDNGFETGVDKVTVSIPLPGGDTKLFARLRVNLP